MASRFEAGSLVSRWPRLEERIGGSHAPVGPGLPLSSPQSKFACAPLFFRLAVLRGNLRRVGPALPRSSPQSKFARTRLFSGWLFYSASHSESGWGSHAPACVRSSPARVCFRLAILRQNYSESGRGPHPPARSLGLSACISFSACCFAPCNLQGVGGVGRRAGCF